MEITDGDAWLTSIQGDVMLKHENGRVEVHGLEGSLTIAAQHSTFETSDVAGDVEAQLVRSLGRFHRLMGDLSIESLMARLEASHVTGALWIQGVLSPITLLQPLTAVTLSSERGNVIVQLDDKDWRLEVTAQRGSIQTSLPQEYEISHERRINSQSLSAVKGRGEALVRARCAGPTCGWVQRCRERSKWPPGQGLALARRIRSEVDLLPVHAMTVVLGDIFDGVAVDDVGGLGRPKRQQPPFHVKLGVAEVDLKTVAGRGRDDQFAPFLQEFVDDFQFHGF